MVKVSLRSLGVERRAALSEDERAAAGRRIQETLLELPEYAAAGSLAVYAAFRGEVATDLVLDRALTAGKEVFLPAVVGTELEFRRIVTRGCLQTGKFGILEPPAGTTARPAAEIDLIVVPGALFDLTGQRIGYGRGYYDRALHRLEGLGKLLAFCYDCQLVEQITGEPHDVRMDRIITERRVIAPVLRK